jgi:hypothetical protein
MISAKLMGGLSNQLFQISAAHALALKNNDVSGFDFDSCYTPNQGFPSNKYKNNILSKVNNIKNYNFKIIYNEQNFYFNQIEYKKNLLLDGYFQSYKYFNEFRDDIINLFHFDNTSKVLDFIKSLNKSNITSVHIRRGDYLNHPNFHFNTPKEYFIKAMGKIPNTHFIFISDDIEWVKNEFKGDNISYSPFNDEIDDLRLMTLCDNNIITNSSFSWWGAYLNKNSNVFSPSIWFGNQGPQYSINDIILPEWILID